MRFRIITKSLQKEFEEAMTGKQDETPAICGYYGRACRQMEKVEGCNRMLCTMCPLANYKEEGGA